MLNLLYIFLGGAIGSVIRFEISKIFLAYFAGTLIVNFLGCFLLGIFSQVKKNNFLTIGFCGGLTTFSTFSYELIFYLQNHQYILFSEYLILSLIAGFVGIYAGIMFIRNEEMEEE